jgi:flavin reductase (DIM6/NTAB) family NADH-FMN oxidoreductase RutF
MEKKVTLGPRTLLFPMPAVLVGAVVDGKPNFMTAAWCGIASHKPPAISVALRKGRYTLKGIEKEKAFSINIPSTDLVKKVDFCGMYSGKDRDKSKVFEVFYGNTEAPLVEECPVNLECKLIHSLDLGSHVLIIGEIIESYVSADCIKNGKVDIKKIDPLVYTTDLQVYQGLGEVIAMAYHVGKQD